jgi:hypothetical protein
LPETAKDIFTLPPALLADGLVANLTSPACASEQAREATTMAVKDLMGTSLIAAYFTGQVSSAR